MRAACGWELSQSGADNLTIAAVCAVGRGLEAPALLVIVPVHFFLRRQLAFFPHTSLLRTQQTSIKTKAVVTAQISALDHGSGFKQILQVQAWSTSAANPSVKLQ